MRSQAVILAAGNGSRLEGCIGATPKCLADIGGRPLIQHQLAALRAAAVVDAVVVVGYEADQVRDAVGDDARFVVNDRYRETNSLYSFMLASPEITGDAFVLNGDVLFPPHVAAELARIGGSSFAFDSSSGQSDEHMKVQLDRGHLVKMSKRLEPSQTTGENVGLLHLDRDAVRTVRSVARLLIEEGIEHAWLASAINLLAVSSRVVGYDIADLPWIEIDFPEDLDRARVEIWPALQRSPSACPRGAPVLPRTTRPSQLEKVLT